MPRSFPLARRVMAWVLLGVSTFSLASCKRAPTEALTVNDLSLKLPRTVGAWTQSGGSKFVGPEDIFNYMDGGGELYLGYRFKRLEVQRYSSADQGEILVEFYWMEASDDAYGLLSLDWGGESILLPSSTSASSSPIPDGPRALYGAGLLRLWSGNLFARIMADRETNASKSAVQALGQAIAAGRSTPSRPQLLQALPASVGSRFFSAPGSYLFPSLPPGSQLRLLSQFGQSSRSDAGMRTRHYYLQSGGRQSRRQYQTRASDVGPLCERRSGGQSTAAFPADLPARQVKGTQAFSHWRQRSSCYRRRMVGVCPLGQQPGPRIRITRRSVGSAVPK